MASSSSSGPPEGWLAKYIEKTIEDILDMLSKGEAQLRVRYIGMLAASLAIPAGWCQASTNFIALGT